MRQGLLLRRDPSCVISIVITGDAWFINSVFLDNYKPTQYLASRSTLRPSATFQFWWKQVRLCDYISYIALEPEYGTTDHPSRLTFSVQDFNGNDIYNLMTMVEIYDSISGKRIHLFPWTFRDVGDFHLYY